MKILLVGFSCTEARQAQLLLLLLLLLGVFNAVDEVDLALPSTLESHHCHLGDQVREALNQRKQKSVARVKATMTPSENHGSAQNLHKQFVKTYVMSFRALKA